PTTDRPIIIEVSGPQERENNVPTPTDSPVCKEEVGPISITFPQEGAVVKDSPVCINIRDADEDYCSVVWSYRINNGTWSEYNSNSPCLYNLPTGDVKFELRVQSTVSQDTDVLERTFKYEGVASDSAQ